MSPHWATYLDNLAVMIDAGLSIETAINTLAVESRDPSTINRLRRSIAKGQSLPISLYRAAVVSQSDLAILTCANTVGKLADGLAFVAARQKIRNTRTQGLRAQFWLPQALLLLASLAAVFIRITQGQSPAPAVLDVAIPATLLWLAARLILSIVNTDSAVFLNLGWPFGFVRKHSNWYQRAFANLLYRNLIWALGSGIAANRALHISSTLLPSVKFKTAMEGAAFDTEAGEALPDALQQNGLILTKEWQQVWKVGAEVGSWDKAVSHHLEAESKRFLRQIEAALKWLPRLYYICVLILFIRVLS